MRILIAVALATLPAAWGVSVVLALLTRLWSQQPIGVDVLLQAPWQTDLVSGYGLLVATLAAELLAVGWQRSSLRRLLQRPSDSALMDWSYAIFSVAGLTGVLSTLVTVGLAAFVSQAEGPFGDFRPAAGLPVWLAAPCCYLAMTFCNYWTHRLLLHGPLWAAHAIHHLPTEFTILNNIRTHPIDVTVSTAAQSLPVVAIGFSPEAVACALVVGRFEAFWNHCNVRGVEWLERFGIFSPLGHALHHSADQAHHNRNFGDMMCVWDRLFGTYLPATAAPADLRLGLDRPPATPGFVAVVNEMIEPWRIWWRAWHPHQPRVAETVSLAAFEAKHPRLKGRTGAICIEDFARTHGLSFSTARRRDRRERTPRQ